MSSRDDAAVDSGEIRQSDIEHAYPIKRHSAMRWLAQWSQGTPTMRKRKAEEKHVQEESGGPLTDTLAQQPASKPSSKAGATAARCKPQLAYAVYAVFLALPLMGQASFLPAAFWKLLTLGGLVVLLRAILGFTRWADEYPHVLRFLACFLLMLLELGFENVMVWIVSATDMRKYDDPPGLQDNGQILGLWLGNQHWLLHWLLHLRWADTRHFLAAVLCLAFSVAWNQVPYSGFGIMSRFSLTICLGRLLRVASFMSTVLPSPRPGCYRARFPPPPDTWWGMLRVGVSTMRGFGGCNDLVFSGHGAFWTTAPLALRAYYPSGRAAQALLWLALVQTSWRDVLEAQHYSVDMLLAVVVTWAVWDWLDWVYPAGRPLQQRPRGSARDAMHPGVLALILGSVGIGAIIVFVGKA